MFEGNHSSRWCGVVLILLLLELVLSAPQGYNYYSHQQRINAQRVQAQRLQAQRIQAQRRYQQANTPTRSSYRKTVSRADSENAKFLGVRNQESEDSPRTYNLIRHKKQQLLAAGNPCFSRSADQSKAEGRFLWDLNVYNYYSNPGINCGGYGGFNGFNGFNGGYGGYGYRPNRGFFQNFLSLFLPGGALNPNVAPVRPFQSPTQSTFQSDSTGSGGLPSGVQSDLTIDPSLDGTGTGISTGSVGSTGSFGGGGAVPQGSNLTPGQLVGGVASTVNGIIQQLSGNPAYPG